MLFFPKYFFPGCASKTNKTGAEKQHCCRLRNWRDIRYLYAIFQRTVIKQLNENSVVFFLPKHIHLVFAYITTILGIRVYFSIRICYVPHKIESKNHWVNVIGGYGPYCPTSPIFNIYSQII